MNFWCFYSISFPAIYIYVRNHCRWRQCMTKNVKQLLQLRFWKKTKIRFLTREWVLPSAYHNFLVVESLSDACTTPPPYFSFATWCFLAQAVSPLTTEAIQQLVLKFHPRPICTAQIQRWVIINLFRHLKKSQKGHSYASNEKLHVADFLRTQSLKFYETDVRKLMLHWICFIKINSDYLKIKCTK